MRRRFPSRRRSRRDAGGKALKSRRIALIAATACLAGCQLPGSKPLPPSASQPAATQRAAQPEPPTGPTLARFQRAYADLAGGRFIILADFNTADQASLCKVVAADGAARPAPEISITIARNETGPGGLTAKLAEPRDRVLFDLDDSPDHPTLVHDWSPYSLFLASVFGPPDGALLELSIASSSGAWARRVHIRPGWNLLRVDLPEIADSIDLKHVQRVAWSAPRLSGALELGFDDFVLADNTRWLLGEAAQPADRLYAFNRGRRLYVGATGRFEIGLADGQIVWWRGGDDLNLAAPAGIGPWPTPLPVDWTLRREAPPAYDDPANFEAWGVPADATQEVIESNPFRVVVRGQWRYETPENRATPIAERPGHSWQYTIYADGRVYVRARSEARTAKWREPRVGYAVAVNQKGKFRHVRSEPAYAQREPVCFALFSPPTPDAPDLLWVPHLTALGARQNELESADGRLAVTLGDIESADVIETAHLLRFWPTDVNGAPDAETFAADYEYPAKLDVRHGLLRSDVAGDLNHDGFNESEGLYELAVTDGLLRFQFDPGRWLRHAPAFRVHGLEGGECWVYCDGRILSPAGRDGAGAPVFTLPQSMGRVMAVEVNRKK